jgi:hypothetical protein
MASIKLYKTLKEARGFCTGLERVYAHEYKGGARGFATMTPEALILQIAQTGTGKSFWHECLWEGEVAGVGSLCDPYIDLDMKEWGTMDREKAWKIKEALENGMRKLMSMWEGGSTVSTYDSCGDDKYSWHVVGRHESMVCESPDVARVMAMVAMALSSCNQRDWFAGNKVGVTKSVVDFDVYTHGYLRTVWSSKRNSSRIKTPANRMMGKVELADTVHLVGAPPGWAGGVWTNDTIQEVLQRNGLGLQEITLTLRALCQEMTNETMPRKKQRTQSGASTLQSPACGGVYAGLFSRLCRHMGEEWEATGAISVVDTKGGRIAKVLSKPKYCPYVGRRHSSNQVHIEIKVDDVPMGYKMFCMAEGCRAKSIDAPWHIFPYELLHEEEKQ